MGQKFIETISRVASRPADLAPTLLPKLENARAAVKGLFGGTKTNAALNGLAGIDAATADWTQWHDDGRYYMIIGADVLYDRAAHVPVAAILARNLADGGRNWPRTTRPWSPGAS